MIKTILQLTKKFVAIKSISGDAKALDEILELALFQLNGYTVERFSRNGVKSALVYNSAKRPKKFKVILNVHLDIIPAKNHQHVPKVKGNKLYGAGSMDMKGGAVALILAFKKVADTVDYPLGLQLVTDEEVGGFNGTKYQIDKGVRADFVIAGEPTNFDIVHKTKGVLLIQVSVKGTTAHGAYPWVGDNAIWKMNEFLDALKKRYPIPKKETKKTTINLSIIETSNQSFNKIPDDCVVGLDVRYAPEDSKTIVKDLRKLLPNGFKLNIVANEQPLFTNTANRYIKALEKSSKKVLSRKNILRGANGTSDARHFARVGSAGIEFGPIGGGIGSDDEWVDIRSLQQYHDIITDFLRNSVKLIKHR